MKSNTFRIGFRVVLCFFTLGAILLMAHLQDLGDQYGVVDYFTFSVSNLRANRPSHSKPIGNMIGDKVIVMAKMEHEDTAWVAEELPDWQRAIYTVNPSARSADVLTTSVNKGHESMAYLTYIIDNYNFSLPSTIAFLHSHRNGFLRAWHTDSPLHDTVDAMRSLQIPFVAHNGYVNLRCNWKPGCGRHSTNTHVTPQIWEELFNETSTPPMDNSESWETGMTGTMASKEHRNKAMHLRGHTASACCAQFAVSREQVRKRPLEDYVILRDWLLRTEKNDAKSGRVFEFIWGYVFGKDAVYCPDEAVCYCTVYGRC